MMITPINYQCDDDNIVYILGVNACKENQSTQNLIQVSGKNDQSVQMQVNLCPPTPSIDHFDQSLKFLSLS